MSDRMDKVFDPSRFKALDAGAARIGLFGRRIRALRPPEQLTINGRDVMRGLTLNVVFHWPRTMTARMWMGAQLIRLAGWVIGCKTDVSVDTGSIA